MLSDGMTVPAFLDNVLDHHLEVYEKELDEMLDDIVQVLTGSAELEQIEIAGYYFHGLEIDMVEAFKEEYEDGTVWQHGVVRVIVKVEQKEM